MKRNLLSILFLGAALIARVAVAQDKLPLLVVQGESYSNVTVTAVSVTHLEFQHSRGVASVKLKNLDPELQKRFKFDPGAAATIESSSSEADARYRAGVAAQKPPVKRIAPAVEAESMTEGGTGGDIVVPTLYAKSFRGQKGPALQVEQWLPSAPDTQGKFVLIDFWATWCGPCRASIPHLNELQAKFPDRLVVIGLTRELPTVVNAMKSPKLEYAVAVDTQGRMQREAEVRGIPHAMLFDPEGIVRFEGMPGYLDEKGLARLLEKYGR